MLKKILNVFKSNNFKFQANDQGWFLPWTDSKPEDEADTFHWAYQFEDHQVEQAIYLAQLATEGFAQITESAWLLPWGNLYPLLADPEYQDVIAALNLPKINKDIIPSIDCKKTLSDPDFNLFIRYWRKGEEQLEHVSLQGGMIQWGSKTCLLSESVWRLCNVMQIFEQRQETQRNQAMQELEWGGIRNLALLAEARFASPYLKNTLIITPQTLQLKMDRKDVLREPIITVSPSFEGAPYDWISRFDRVNSVPKHYDFSSAGKEQYRVILSEPVRRVLDVIKRDMPNRRVVGRKAEAFLRNPYALLGESSHGVIDEGIFTKERDKLGDLQHSWSLEPKLEQGWIIHVDVRVEADEQVNNEAIVSSSLLHNFLLAIEDGLSQQQLSYKWKGYRLLLDHQAQQHLAQGERILAMWEQQESSGIHRINYEDIYDLRQYGERVIGISESKPIAIPVLLKPESNEQGWSPEFEPALLIQLPGAEEPVLLPATQDFCTTLNAHIQAAEESHAKTVELPYLHLSVPLEQAQHAARVISDHLQTKLGNGSDTPPKEKPVYQTLIIETNFGNLDYIEQRKKRLTIPDNFQYRLPENLRPEIRLKPHQIEGVQWLQYLSSLHGECHGALLADDMGLGKTLQLLCLFMILPIFQTTR